MWHGIIGWLPGWERLAQSLLILAVPLGLTRMMLWFRAEEGKASTRGQRGEGQKGGGVPSSEDTGEAVQSSIAASNKNPSVNGARGGGRDAEPPLRYCGRLQEDVASFRAVSSDMSDVNVRYLQIGKPRIPAVLFFVDGLTDKEGMDINILKPLMNAVLAFDGEAAVPPPEELKMIITQRILQVSEIEYTDEIMASLKKVLFGSAVLLVEGMPEVIVLGTSKGNTRSVEEPISEALLRGPRVGFNETLSDNTALLRRHGQHTGMVMHSYTVGNRIEKEMMLAYIKGIANEELIEEIIRRIRTINIDDVQESGFIEQLLEDNYLSPFQQIQSTERPDRVMAALLEGRAAILLDGTPFALIMPVTFGMLLQSPEDYYDRWFSGSLLRILRFVAATISLFAPALYISFLSFHPGLIPTKLAISIISSRQGVPFPTLVEALIMEVAIEILREAGLRLPKPIGPAMGIVGGLIIGQAAVEAGIVSPILVIVVALTAISSFSVPMYSAGITLRLLRFAAMFFAAMFGLYGIVLFFLLLSSHLINLKSFGVPYLSMITPYRMSDLRDFIIRIPLQLMKRRPTMLQPEDKIRKR
ncbi:spore germination protein ['Paenibacillus yunnanensis' Narsing Rao et al. 2020]|uniref:spore germination protein n=1 Tax=Paenibacillus tengchongensis TaxID=2608684 RepID=UPI00124E840D